MNLGKLLRYIKKISNIIVGIQISHSGRKGSAHIPWEKPNTPLKDIKKKWTTVAPSPIRKDNKWPTPKELSSANIENLKKDFKTTANNYKWSKKYV